jgi:predicted thioredoxin/glutaredoxin
MPHWTVYSRPECGLCDELIRELAGLLGPADRVTVIDISGDPELERRYGQRVPVLLADGEFVCAWRLDPVRVRALLT